MSGPCQISLKIKLFSWASTAPALKSVKVVCRSTHIHIFSVFVSQAIKTKNRNRSMNKFKNLGYDRWLQYKKPRQESGLCCFAFAPYSQKCVIQFIELCIKMPCLCPSEGHKHGGRNVTKTFAIEMNIFSLELRHIEINASSSASTV